MRIEKAEIRNTDVYLNTANQLIARFELVSIERSWKWKILFDLSEKEDIRGLRSVMDFLDTRKFNKLQGKYLDVVFNSKGFLVAYGKMEINRFVYHEWNTIDETTIDGIRDLLQEGEEFEDNV